LTGIAERIYGGVLRTTLQKWGNSHGIRIPKAIMDVAGIAAGSEMEIEILEGSDAIVIRPVSVARPVRGRYRIEDLVSKMPEGDKPCGEEWGEALGEEAW